METMTFEQLLIEKIPSDLGVLPVCGEAAMALVKAEQADPDLFPAKKFSTVRERIEIIMRCFAGTSNKAKYEFYENVLELKALSHENTKHSGSQYKEDTFQREAFLEAADTEAASMAATVRDFWTS